MWKSGSKQLPDKAHRWDIVSSTSPNFLNARLSDLALAFASTPAMFSAAGYDLREAKSYKATFREFDKVIGLSELRAIHVNDSKRPLDSRVDRHEQLGKGEIGEEAFRLVV